MPTKIIVRCVPERARFIAYLRARLPGALYYFHPVRDAVDAFIGALKQAGNKPAIHMEDDVILTRGFRKKLESVIAKHPHTVIQFFSMRKDDLVVGSRFDRNFLMLQCVYLPFGYSQMLAAYDWPRREQDPTACDVMLADWLKARKEAYWIHCPNLVDHRQCQSVIDSRRSSTRQSKTFTAPWL